ncbi:hypothetical protein BC351_10380 [Paenibacillus ferrarius]|uniref:Uncharacterized protein n=1 Tax=Paenibacillus ferrarius TaxID=1469647 RepID=A0A1V4H9A8_9BACL|nr:hypothetical protein [Paenibacillus ferrarius]OPH47589.1 hypothetical protein BC351_10380 [Paenibacillus ferrarius]
MINFVNFMIFSSIEFLSVIILMLTIFQFTIKYYIKEVISTSVIMSLFSYFFVIYDVGEIFVVLQIFSLIMLFKFVFKERNWMYSIVVPSVSYIIFVFLQAILIGLFIYAGYFNSMQELKDAFTVKTYTFQLIEFIFCLFICISFKIFRQQGFAFRADSKIKKMNHFIGTVIVCVILSTALLYAFNQSLTIQYFIFVFVGLIIITLILIYFSIKRNEAEYAPEVYGLKNDKKEV